MKTKTKALLLALCAVMLVVATVFVTMAFLTDDATVTNTFTVGKVEITLDEAVVNEMGVVAEGSTDRTSEGLEYKLVPGHKYTKDPTIHVADDSEDCWLFAKIENGLGKDATLTMVSGWSLVTGTDNVYKYGTKQSAGNNVTVFTDFTFGQTADPSDYTDAEIIITAYAIQADGFESAEAAWTAASGNFS